jgi:hypothetical protein
LPEVEESGDMIYVKSILVGIATLFVSTGLLLFVLFALYRQRLGWGFYINIEPIYVLIPLLFFAAGYCWEFRRKAKKSV